ncbi:hypothetical protein VULLAG_LOCUS19467 [Vulpes lagopus]
MQRTNPARPPREVWNPTSATQAWANTLGITADVPKPTHAHVRKQFLNKARCGRGGGGEGDPFPAASLKVAGGGTQGTFPRLSSATGAGGLLRALGLSAGSQSALPPSPSFPAPLVAEPGEGRLGFLLKKSHRFVELRSAPRTAPAAGAGAAATGRSCHPLPHLTSQKRSASRRGVNCYENQGGVRQAAICKQWDSDTFGRKKIGFPS